MVSTYVRQIFLFASVFLALGAVACAEAQATDPAGSVTRTATPVLELAATPDPVARVWQTRINRAIGDETCGESPHVLNPDHYPGPLIDSHFHIPHMPDSRPVQGELTSQYLDVANIERFNHKFPILGVNKSITEIVCTLKNEGTDGVLAFFPVFPQIAEPSIELARRTMEQYPDLFLPFINAAGSGEATVGNEELIERLSVHPGLFVGYGEIPLYSDGSPGDNGLPPDSPIFNGIYATAADYRIAVYFHAGDNQFDSLSQMLADNRDVNFILHGDQIQNEIMDLMALHSNVYYTVDALYGDQYLLHQRETTGSFIDKISDIDSLLQIDLDTWKVPIETYPDQFMWGTDRGGAALWTFDIEVGRALSAYGRAFISGLDPAAQERFAYKNVLVALGLHEASPQTAE